ncbi:unnamed protein product, partial [Prorocentrum cordatum]
MAPSAQPPANKASRPKVGVGVFVTSAEHPGCVLLGRRRGSAGSGTWALPGGHQEAQETWQQAAEREVWEEAALRLRDVRVATVINSMDPASGYHYCVVFMSAAARGEPVNAEPDKCDGWSWHPWDDPLPEPVFKTLSDLRSSGFNPFTDCGTVLGEEPLPPYCCAILATEAPSCGAGPSLLLEHRSQSAEVAAGQLTCFGGKREPGEAPLDCVRRECREELGWEAGSLTRVVDLYSEKGSWSRGSSWAPRPPRARRSRSRRGAGARGGRWGRCSTVGAPAPPPSCRPGTPAPCTPGGAARGGRTSPGGEVCTC